jgi:hypothetical protein
VCKRLVIRNGDDAQQANTLLHDISAERRKISDEHKHDKAPALAECRRIDARKNVRIKLYDEAEAALKDAIARYAAETTAVHTQQIQAAAAAHVAGDHLTAAAHTAVASQVAADSLPLQGTSVRWRWVGNVTQPDLVRRELCSPDASKVAAVAALATDQPPPAEAGITWERKPIVTVRHNGSSKESE